MCCRRYGILQGSLGTLYFSVYQNGVGQFPSFVYKTGLIITVSKPPEHQFSNFSLKDIFLAQTGNANMFPG